MKTFLYFCLVVASPILYFELTPMLSFYQYYPILSYLGMALGVFLLIRLMRNQFTKLRLAAVIISGVLFVAFLWYTLGYSEYASNTANITAGEIADENLRRIVLSSTTGEELHLGNYLENNQATLIVLNRGSW